MLELVQQNTMTSTDDNEQPNTGNAVKVESVKGQMDETFSNNDMMDAFMEHLFAEYCAECLLSVIEFSQFKKLIKKQNKDIEENQHQYGFCKSVPQSEIISAKSSDYRSIATQLYKKYIAVSAVWEINIDYAARNNYAALFERQEIEQSDEHNAEFYYTLFDHCIDIMIALITPSFSRFKNTQKYKMILQC